MAKEGICLLIKNGFADHMTNIETIDSIAIKLDVQFKNKKNMRCILVYRPVDKTDNDNKIQQIVNKLEKWNNINCDRWNIIILGDLNEHYNVEYFIKNTLQRKGKKMRILNWLINHFILIQLIFFTGMKQIRFLHGSQA